MTDGEGPRKNPIKLWKFPLYTVNNEEILSLQPETHIGRSTAVFQNQGLRCALTQPQLFVDGKWGENYDPLTRGLIRFAWLRIRVTRRCPEQTDATIHTQK